MLLCKMVAMVILHPFLSSGHIMPNVAKQESYLRLYICILLELSVYPFNPWQVFYRLIVNVHEED